MDVEEMHLFEQALHKDELFIRELSKVRLPEGAIVVADPWIYGVLRWFSRRFLLDRGTHVYESRLGLIQAPAKTNSFLVLCESRS